jgi:Arc/MetJ-type ribon-helix-helix transcriptional regulator
MTINLSPSQIEWLEAEVAAGRFASIDEAAQAIVNDDMVRETADRAGDIGWAKPLLDDARAQIARGELVELETFNGQVDQLIRGLEK